MKEIIYIALALCILLSLSVTAFAAPTETVSAEALLPAGILMLETEENEALDEIAEKKTEETSLETPENDANNEEIASDPEESKPEEKPAEESATDIVLQDEQEGLEAENSLPVVTFSDVNPLYEGIAESPYPAVTLDGAAATEVDHSEYVTTAAEASALVREAMKARQGTFTIYFAPDYAITSSSQLMTLFSMAVAHTGVGDEGDYLRWSYLTVDANALGEQVDGQYYYAITWILTYYTDAAQETEVTAAVSNLIGTLELPKKSDYETIRAIYDWICSNVSYDYANLNDSTYTLKFSAYAAIIHKTAVCQGYASLFYRLALTCGIDARLIAGYSGSTPHGWCIVKLGDYYYNVDPTWDAGASSYSYFLCGTTDFSGHAANSEYTAASFTSAYPIPDSAYTCTLIGDIDGNGSISMVDAIALVRVNAGWDIEYSEAASDINGDGSVSLVDCIVLVRYLAGWTGESIYNAGLRI